MNLAYPIGSQFYTSLDGRERNSLRLVNEVLEVGFKTWPHECLIYCLT